MKTIRRIAWGIGTVPVLALAHAGCGSPNGGGLESAVTQSPTPSVIVRTLSKQKTTKVSLRTLPNASCTLVTDGAPGALPLFSDERGVVSFYGLPQADGTSRHVTLRCSDESGSSTVQPIELRVDEATSSLVLQEAAEREALEAVPHPGAVVLPALSREQAATLGEDDIRSLGYPPRGTAEVGSTEYEHWIQLVSKPITVLPQHPIETGVFHGPAYAENGPGGTTTNPYWSGIVLDGGDAPGGYKYAIAYGLLVIPIVTPNTTSNIHTSSLWVGLDGYSTGDVVQDGSEQDTVNGTSNLYTWIEYYPAGSKAISLRSDPLDLIETWTWMSNSTGHNGSTHILSDSGYGWFYLFNETWSESSGYLSIKTPANSPPFSGSSVEWIMERNDFAAHPLTQYTAAAIDNAFSRDFSTAAHSYLTDPYVNVTLVGSSNDVLSTAKIVPDNNTTPPTWEVGFDWHASH